MNATIKSTHLKRKLLLSALVLITLAGCVRSSTQGPAIAARAAAQDDVVTVTLTPELQHGALRVLKVEMRFAGDADGETVLLLPRNADVGVQYWETLSDFQVVNGEIVPGAPDERTLRHQGGATITVSYHLGPNFPHTPYNNILEPTYFAAIGEGLFGRLKDRDARYRFDWGRIPLGWTVASDLEHARMTEVGAQADLLGSTLIGGSDVVVAQRLVGGARWRVAMRSGSSLDRNRFADVVARIGAAANATWNEPAKEFLVSIVTLPDFGYEAGLALDDAFAMRISDHTDPLQLRHYLAHEYAHSWIPDRLGGGNAWFREGFAEYYARVINIRVGGYPWEAFAKEWNSALLNYANSPHRLARDADTEPKFYTEDHAYRIANDRGGMIAALLDYRLRTHSGGRVGLLSVLLNVKEDMDRGAGEGDGPSRLVRKAREMTGLDLQPELDRILVAGEPLLFPDDLFGHCATVATVTIPAFQMGVRARVGHPIEYVNPESRAYAAGLREGMIMVRREGGVIGDSRVEVAYRIVDGGQERVIRFYPVGTGTITAQEIMTRPGSTGEAAMTCLRSLSAMSARTETPA